MLNNSAVDVRGREMIQMGTWALTIESVFHLVAEEEFREIMCVQETPRAVVLCGWRGPHEKTKTEETRPTATKDTGSSVPKTARK